jgi:carboxyl-terminal processing protease
MLAERKALEEKYAYSFTEYFVAPPPPPRIKAEKTKSEDDKEADEFEEDDEAENRYKRMDTYLREGLRVLADLTEFTAKSSNTHVARVAR